MNKPQQLCIFVSQFYWKALAKDAVGQNEIPDDLFSHHDFPTLLYTSTCAEIPTLFYT